MEAVTEKKAGDALSVPKGYKKTKIGWIPEEWEIKQMDDVVTLLGGFAFKSNLMQSNKAKYQVVKMSNVYQGFLSLERTPSFLEKITDKEKKYILKEGDIIMSLTGTIGKRDYGYAAVISDHQNLLLNQRLCKYSATKISDQSFLLYLLKSSRFLYYFFMIGRGGTGNQANVGINEIKQIEVAIPPLPEQQKIAQILSTWDKAIEQTQKLIEQLKNRKKGLFDNLLLGKVRVNGKTNGFKKTKLGVDIPNEWDTITVGNVFQERKEVSNNIEQYPLYSLTIDKGLTEKTAQYERSFLLKDKENNKYRLVYDDDILYNPMNLRFGAIAKASISNPVSVSAYYNVLKPKDSNINIDYFINLFKTYRYMHIYDRIAIGSLEEKKRVHLSMFLKLELPHPPIEEQLAITKILTTADKEIKTQESYLQQIQDQKKGLMQQLLTGQKRVKVV
ncbi:MAG: restriction endonuclease subunit S [Bacteroidales bacterium]|jgi:type I restriction enzyme S subunit|nr:restriction endonuclease subunit S [Bacteroidales bacterium]